MGFKQALPQNGRIIVVIAKFKIRKVAVETVPDDRFSDVFNKAKQKVFLVVKTIYPQLIFMKIG
jgi:hypothetical protein